MLFTSKTFWLGDAGVLVRAVRTAAQTAIALLGVSQFSLFTVDWKNVVGVSGASALLSVLMSLDRSTEVAKITVNETVAPAPQPVIVSPQPAPPASEPTPSVQYPVW